MYEDCRLSDVIATDMTSLLHSDGEFPKMKEFVSSDPYSNYNHHQNNHIQNHIKNDHPRSNINNNIQNGQSESPLMRYRSAPSSFYVNLLDDFLNSPVDESSNHEFFSDQHQKQQNKEQQQHKSESQEYTRYDQSSSSLTYMKLEPKESGIQKMDFTKGDLYDGDSHQSSHLKPDNGNGIYNHTHLNSLESSSTFRSINSTSSNLIRQSSSPAGFLATLNSERGFASIRDVEKTSRLNNNISFSQGLSSSSMCLPKTNDSSFKSLKRTRDGDSITLERQDGSSGNCTPSLVHHSSLPKTSSEMALAEKFLRFEQQMVPSNTRAKRGCATHPRSIAERVRRTRISDRIKKLQELFPSMDKQTSTSDMLDMAVKFIKDLQKDLQTLKDARSKCTCSSKQ